MKIKIRKKHSLNYLLYALVFMPCILRGIVIDFGVPISIYIFDIFIFLMIIIRISLKNYNIFNEDNIIIWFGILIIILVSIVNYAVKQVTIVQYFRGMYNFIHFFICIAVFIVVIKKGILEDASKILFLITTIDAIFMIYQYFFMGLMQDKLGGIFGNSNGCNGIQNTICCLGLIILFTGYQKREVKLLHLIIYCLLTSVMAGLSELTIYYFEIIIIIVCAILLNRNRKITVKSVFRILIVIISIVAILYIGIRILIFLFPTKIRFLQISNVFEYLGLSGKNTGVYKISRINAISQMHNMFLNSPFEGIFGLGLGHTIEGGIFSSMYSAYQYNWFSTAITVLETGYLGVIVRLGILIFIFMRCQISKRKVKNDRWILVSQLSVIVTIILFFYNNTMENAYDSYMLAFFIASYAAELRN